MGKQFQHIDENTLAKYFANELTHEERESVDSWRKDSPNNQRIFDESFMIWQDLGVIHAPQNLQVDIDAAWSRQLNIQEFGQYETPKSIWKNNWFIAASVALLVSLGIWFTFQHSEVNQINIVAESILNLNLEDGSNIELNRHADLSYPEHFDKNQRTVQLKSGEAFFDIAKDSKRPFEIEIGPAKVQVLGTSFFINSGNSYDTICVVVKTGLVKFGDAFNTITMQPGDRAIYTSGQVFYETIDLAGVEEFWKTKSLNFEAQKLTKVVAILSEAYQVPIEIESELIKNCRLTVYFENQSLDQIFEIISATLLVEVNKNGLGYVITGEGCE